MSYKPNTLLFLDIETTGLHERARLLEIGALLVRASDLEIVAPFQTIVECRDGPSTDVWETEAFKMHAANGLLGTIAGKSPSLATSAADAVHQFEAWLKKLGQPAKTCSIAGSSVHMDVAFLRRQVPDFDWSRFSHRLLDISTLRAFSEIAGLKLFPEKKEYEGHRALADCHQDLEQLRVATAKARNLWSVTITDRASGDVIVGDKPDVEKGEDAMFGQGKEDKDAGKE